MTKTNSENGHLGETLQHFWHDAHVLRDRWRAWARRNDNVVNTFRRNQLFNLYITPRFAIS